MYVELHLLQSFAPSNLNRDDTNNPKDCEFGGVRRARISSQCLKRSMRTARVFAETTKVPNATRSKRLVMSLAEKLVAQGKDLEEATRAMAVLVAAHLTGIDKKAKEPLTDVVMHQSVAEQEALIEAALENWEGLLDADEKKANKVAKDISKGLIKRFKEHTSAPDTALFGRMLASTPQLGLEASCQVAHAISTHRVSMEIDFFTAVDDLSPADNAGAGMMGVVAYNSACFYRYMRVDFDHLVENLDGDVALALRTLEGLLRAAEDAVPSAKQNSMAANNPPSLALAVVRDDGMGWSLVNAFEQPVRVSRDSGYVAPSVAALDKFWGALCDNYGTDTLKLVAARTMGEQALENLSDNVISQRNAWIDAVLGAVTGAEV